MELKLYQHIRKNFLKETIDLFDKSTQEKIEAFDASIGFDEKILDAVKKYLKAYNTFLEVHKQNKVALLSDTCNLLYWGIFQTQRK